MPAPPSHLLFAFLLLASCSVRCSQVDMSLYNTSTLVPLLAAWRSSPTPVSLVAHALDDNRFQLVGEQCHHLTQVFASSGLTSALYQDSCQSRYITMDRLYDGNILIRISMDGWTFGNRSVVNIATLNQHVTLDFTYALLVVRIDSCASSGEPVIVRIHPPPRFSENGLVQMNFTDSRAELLMTSESTFRDLYEINLVKGDAKCSLDNSYLFVCVRDNRRAACQVRLFDAELRQVECHCDETSNYALLMFNALLLILLIIFSALNFNNAVEDTAVNEETIMGAISSRGRGYHYQVIYRVGCPTVDFDCHKTILKFEILGPDFEPLGTYMAFSLSNLNCIQFNVFTVNAFLPAPMVKVKAVRVQHNQGVPKSGIFLFDVQINFISGPEDDAFSSIDDYRTRPPIVNESLIRNQRLKIYSYILEHEKVYTKLRKGAKLDMPPLSYPPLSVGFFKILVWLAATQTVLFATIVLDFLYLRWQMMALSLVTALLITLVLCLVLACIVYLHSYLNLESITFELYECLASSKKKAPPPRTNWFRHLDTTLLLLLLLLIGATMVTIVFRSFDQPFIKALQIEAIFVNVLVFIGSISWFIYETIDRWPMLVRQRVATEQRLMGKSALRGALFSFSEKNIRGSSESSSSSTVDSSNAAASTLTKGTFEFQFNSGPI